MKFYCEEGNKGAISCLPIYPPNQHLIKPKNEKINLVKYGAINMRYKQNYTELRCDKVNR